MNRSPLFYPLNRGMDAEPGGAADLQTDVMRFMAILSICLVAIFALVQSMPLVPEAPDEPEASAKLPPPAPAAAEEPELDRQDVVLTRPLPASKAPKQGAVILHRPQPAPAHSAPRVGQAVVPAPAETPQDVAKPRGFTLRFASDRALTRLVEHDVVRLYAISGGETRKLAIDGGRLSFWTASAPEKVHDMDAATVPAAIVDAWRRSAAATKPAVRWGVSLPPALSRQISEYLASADGGSLIIEQDGSMKLEQ